MGYNRLENDIEEEVEGVAGQDNALGKGCVYERVIKTLTKDQKPVCRVPFRLHRIMALFEFPLVTNNVLKIR